MENIYYYFQLCQEVYHHGTRLGLCAVRRAKLSRLMDSYVVIAICNFNSHHRCSAVSWADTRRTPWIEHTNIVVGFTLDDVSVAADTND